MRAGYAALTQVFTAERAEEFEQECEGQRQTLNDELAAKNVPEANGIAGA
jgi:hypothetical protein